jgi:hypothetical protein
VRAAKDKLDKIEYPYDAYWTKTGLECGFDAAKTYDEVMVETLMVAPDWTEYWGMYGA